MTHTYQLTGMTCNSCEAKVKSSLLMVEHVSDIAVSKDESSTTIIMDKHIPVDKLQKALPEYKIAAVP
jgi:copper chaperone CopZ